MAITTLAELRLAIGSRLKRADAAPSIPDYIRGAEDLFNRELRFREMEQRSTASLTSEYLAVPTDFLQVRNVQLNTSPKRALSFVTPEYMDIRWGGRTGLPQQFTIINGSFQFGPAPDGTYTVEIDYYKELTPLAADDDTNWLLDRHPMLYLYGALAMAGDDAGDARGAQWAQLLAQHMESAKRADTRGRWSGSVLQMKVA